MTTASGEGRRDLQNSESDPMNLGELRLEVTRQQDTREAVTVAIMGPSLNDACR